MTNAEDIYQKLVAEDFSVLNDISGRVPHDVYVVLAEHLVAVLSKQLKLSPLLSWAIKHEVQQTKNYTLIFREDSLSKALVNRVLFDNVGVKYLRLLLTPMIQNIAQYDQPLEIAAHKVELETAIQNKKKLLSALDIFVTKFQESEMSCPLIIRKLLMHLHHNVVEKFGDDEQVPFSLHFFFFQYVCLAMINPEKYGIVGAADMNNSLRVGLLNASKLLKDLAGGTERDSSSEDFSDYQKKNGPVLVECFNSLIDPKSIQTAEKILTANTTTIKVKSEDIQQVKDAFIKFLVHEVDDLTVRSSLSQESVSSDSSTPDLESPEAVAQVTSQLLEKMNRPEWRMKKKKKGQSLWTLKDKNENAVSVKVEMDIAASLNDTVKFFHDYLWSSKYDANGYDWRVTYQGNNYRENIIKYRMPFPMSDRDFSFSEWLTYPTKDSVIQIRMQNKRNPIEPGIVRGKVCLNGGVFKAIKNEEGAEMTHAVVVIHADPCGSIPKWVVNAQALNQADKIIKMKNALEKLAAK